MTIKLAVMQANKLRNETIRRRQQKKKKKNEHQQPKHRFFLVSILFLKLFWSLSLYLCSTRWFTPCEEDGEGRDVQETNKSVVENNLVVFMCSILFVLVKKHASPPPPLASFITLIVQCFSFCASPFSVYEQVEFKKNKIHR